jgi:hypothetical protein
VSIPEGWTGDFNVPGATDAELQRAVELVLQDGTARVPVEQTLLRLITELRFSEEWAHLACDRIYGGLVRAATGNVANCPDKQKDPLAWISFHRCLNDPSIIVAIRPEWAGKLPVQFEPSSE